MKRREWLTRGGLFFGGMLAGGGSTILSSEKKPEAEEEFVWNYEPLDPRTTAEEAYRLYSEGSCMFATFRSIVEGVGRIRKEKNPAEGTRWESFPFYMMTYGRGGVHDCGSLCGILNGCSAAISLFVRTRNDAAGLTRELFDWYESSELPNFVPSETKFGEIEQSVSESPLCHISVSRWIQVSESEAESPRRKERCKRMVGDGVIKTIELLNRYFQSRQEGKPCPFAEPYEPTASCIECHSPKGSSPDVNARMNCSVCHEETTIEMEAGKHPATAKAKK